MNVAYTLIRESLDEEEWKDFLNELRTVPGEKVRPRSRVSPGLMDMMRPGRSTDTRPRQTLDPPVSRKAG